MVSSLDDPAVQWLLQSEEPAVVALTRRDVLGLQDVGVTRAELVEGAWMAELLNGGEGRRPFQKYDGAHWRLVSLVELGVPPDEPRARAAAEQLCQALGTPMRKAPRRVAGLVRRCASEEGNALAVLTRLNLHQESMVHDLAERLTAWQWPDGGWNCDPKPSASRSSFHETLPAIWGLHEYASRTGDTSAAAAAAAGVDLLLSHRLFRRSSDGSVIDPAWLEPRYPPYWHYDVLQALLVLSRIGEPILDERASDGLEVIQAARARDGLWHRRLAWWRPPGSRVAPEVVDWGGAGPSLMLSLNATRVLGAASQS